MYQHHYDRALMEQLEEEYSKSPFVKSIVSYDDEFQFRHAEDRIKKLEKVLEEKGTPLHKDLKVLEIGCGAGYVAQTLASRYGCEVWGVDCFPSKRWPKAEAETGGNLHFLELDLTAAEGKIEPLEYASFDLVVSYAAWEHVHHPLHMLEQAAGLLKKDGLLFIYAALYRSARASHLYSVIHFPWPHLLFDEELIFQFAKDRGVEEWWLDAFFHVNKLTYAQYRESFEKLHLKLLWEDLIRHPIDWDFYERFSEKLELYPIEDLELDYFTVLLSKPEEGRFYARPVRIREVKVKQQKEDGKIVLRAEICCPQPECMYAWRIYRNGCFADRLPYSRNNRSIEYEVKEPGTYLCKGFLKTADGRTDSLSSKEIEIDF